MLGGGGGGDGETNASCNEPGDGRGCEAGGELG